MAMTVTAITELCECQQQLQLLAGSGLELRNPIANAATFTLPVTSVQLVVALFCILGY